MSRLNLLIPLVLLVAGCKRTETAGRASQSLGMRDVRIVASDYKFVPNVIEATPGENLRITVVNKGSHDHSFVIGGGENNRAELREVLKPEQTGSFKFTMPKDVAYVDFHCPVARHDSRGMTGRIVARRPDSGSNSGVPLH